MNRVLAAFFLLIGSVSFQLFAGVHIHEASRVQFQIPDGWQAGWTNAKQFEAKSHDGTLQVDIYVLTPDEVMTDARPMSAKIKRFAPESEKSTEKKMDIHGVEATWREYTTGQSGKNRTVVSVVLGVNRMVVTAVFYLEGDLEGHNKAFAEGIAHSLCSAPIRPKEGAKIFDSPAKTPAAGALRALLFMASAEVDNLDKAINWPTVHAQMVRLGQAQGMTAEQLRQDTISQFRSGMKPSVEKSAAMEGFLLIWEDLKVAYKSPSRASVQLPKAYRNMVIEVIKVDGVWLMAEFTM